MNDEMTEKYLNTVITRKHLNKSYTEHKYTRYNSLHALSIISHSQHKVTLEIMQLVLQTHESDSMLNLPDM